MDLQQQIDWFNQELVSTPTIASHQPHDLYISQHNVHLNQNDPPTPIIVPSNGLFNIQQPLIVSSQVSMIEQPIVPSQRIYEPHVVLSQSIKRPHNNESFISTKKPRRHTVSSSFPPPILTSNLQSTSISAPRSAAPDARIHEKIKAYECMTKEQLITRLLELETRQCKWKECREVFTEPSKLTLHLTEIHVKSDDKAGTFRCEWEGCLKHAIKRHKMYSHLRLHSGDRPYLCDECGKRFSRPESLATHCKTH